MHSSPDFTAHMLGLLKNSGTTGNSGTGLGKHLISNEKTGTAQKASLVPVRSDRYQAGLPTGSANCKAIQPLRKPVTSGTTGTAIFDKADERAKSDGPPSEWYAILAELKARDPVEWLSPQRWSKVISDTEIFLATWGNAADRFGWSALEMFGVHPLAPTDRFDLMGLVLLIHGGEVVALTACSATIRRTSGAILTFRKSDQTGAVLLSEVRS